MTDHLIINEKLIESIFRPRLATSHKGDHGHSLVVAGSPGKMGAACIAAKACLRSGTGLLTVLIPSSERFYFQSLPEAMLAFREDLPAYGKFTAASIGPGLGTDAKSAKLLKACLEHFNKSNLVLDADSFTILAQRKKWWKQISEGTILTPHPGEFDRMFGKHPGTEERIHTAKKICSERNWIIILKGFNSSVIDKDSVSVNTTGNAGLAKGGSGDALTGILTAFLSEGYSAMDSSLLAVYLHGLAADIAITHQSPESLLINDVIDAMGLAFRTIKTNDQA